MPPVDSALEPPDTPQLLSIGELAERTGVAATALRYYDDLGLVRPAVRASGRRRYTASAVTQVCLIVFLREVGFSLAEIGTLVVGADRRTWQEITDRKLADLAEQRRRLDVASAALEHGQRCPASHPLQCPRFWSIIEGRQHGLSLEESHARVHEGES